jgi:hypothetical protein
MDWSRVPTLILSIASVLAALTTILKFGKDFAEQIRSMMAGDEKPFVIERPRLFLSLVGLLVMCVAALLLIRSPQKSSSTVASIGTHQGVGAASGVKMHAEGSGVVVGGQSGTGNSQQVIGALTQSGGSGCTQNVGIGSDNTLNCKPELPKMSSAQVDQVSALLANAPKIPGKVIVSYETTSDENGQLAKQLNFALVKAGIRSTVEGYGLTIGSDIDYPGLSIESVKGSTVDLANAIEKALLMAKVISQPLKPANRNMKDAGDNLVFEIRNP